MTSLLLRMISYLFFERLDAMKLMMDSLLRDNRVDFVLFLIVSPPPSMMCRISSRFMFVIRLSVLSVMGTAKYLSSVVVDFSRGCIVRFFGLQREYSNPLRLFGMFSFLSIATSTADTGMRQSPGWNDCCVVLWLFFDLVSARFLIFSTPLGGPDSDDAVIVRTRYSPFAFDVWKRTRHWMLLCRRRIRPSYLVTDGFDYYLNTLRRVVYYMYGVYRLVSTGMRADWW